MSRSATRLLQLPLILLASIALAAVPAVEVTLRGSPASMQRQHQIAVSEKISFVRTPSQLGRLADEGRLVPVPGGTDYELARVSYPFAVPEVRAFLEYIAPRYHAACGEALVVTSLMRPETGQPSNAHALSVHPAGLAVDFRISQSQPCRKWLEEELLALERENILDATRETSPPHYHVAIFPEGLRTHLASDSVAGSSAGGVGAERTGASAGSTEQSPGSRGLWPLLVVVFTGVLALLAYWVLRFRSRRVRAEPALQERAGAGPGADTQPRDDLPTTRSTA